MSTRDRLLKLLEFAIQATITTLLVRYGIMPPSGGLGGGPGSINPAVTVTAPDVHLPSLPPINVVIPPTPTPVPAMPPTPKRQADPHAANVQLLAPNYRCSATIVGEQAADGSYMVLTAGHCIERVGQRLSFRLRDGREFMAVAVAVDRRSDVGWCRTSPTQEDYPHAELAPRLPRSGEQVWHEGYGVDRPHNHEVGTVTSANRPDGQIEFSMSFSAGDSGAGIFNSDGKLVAVVSSTARQGFRTRAFGGSSVSAAALLDSGSGVIPSAPDCPNGQCPTK